MACLGHMVFAVVVAIFLVQIYEATIDIKGPEINASTEACFGKTACGWAVYNKSLRIVDYFLKNNCVCTDGKICVRDEDDMSIGAYVYVCKIDDPDHPGKDYRLVGP